MPTARETFPEQEFVDWAAANNAAIQAVSISGGMVIPGIKYEQGNRRFITTSLSLGRLVKLVQQIKPPPKKDLPYYDVENNRNRPLDSGHKRIIREYLINVKDYLLPPILLNSRQPLQIFAVKSPAAAVPCVFILPEGDYLDVTDGQHRIEGVREALSHRRDLGDHGVSVSIVEELNINKTHQDFYDAAQTKQLTPAQLVEYDQREALHWLTREVVKSARIFQDRVQRLGTKVGAKSLHLFTNSMVKRAIQAMLTGNPDAKEGAMDVAEQAREIWYERILEFLDVFTEQNPQWAEIAHRSIASGQTVEIPMLRDTCVHTIGAGLLVIGGVAHGIFAMSPAHIAKLTPEQLQYTHAMAKDIDWRRNNELWHRSIVNPLTGSIQPHIPTLTMAITDVKRVIGLPLSTFDEKRLADAEAKLAKKQQQDLEKYEKILQQRQEVEVGV